MSSKVPLIHVNPKVICVDIEEVVDLRTDHIDVWTSDNPKQYTIKNMRRDLKSITILQGDVRDSKERMIRSDKRTNDTVRRAKKVQQKITTLWNQMCDLRDEAFQATKNLERENDGRVTKLDRQQRDRLRDFDNYFKLKGINKKDLPTSNLFEDLQQSEDDVIETQAAIEVDEGNASRKLLDVDDEETETEGEVGS